MRTRHKLVVPFLGMLIAILVSGGHAAPHDGAARWDEGPPRYAEGPPPGHTGGFGEPSCYACHWDRELNAPGGILELEGLPDVVVPGERYDLTLRLAHPEMAAAGFQLAIRFAEPGMAGVGAGTIRAGPGQDLVVGGDPEVAYLRQTAEGSAMEREGAAEWGFAWVAPAETRGAIAFHASANAANGDVSEFGDRIYTLERVVGSDTNAP